MKILTLNYLLVIIFCATSCIGGKRTTDRQPPVHENETNISPYQNSADSLRDKLFDDFSKTHNIVDTVKKQISERKKKDIYSIYTDFSPKIDSIEHAIDSLTNIAESLDPIPEEIYQDLSESLTNCLIELLAFEDNLKRNLQQKWQGSTFFNPGQYKSNELTTNQLYQLNLFIDQIKLFYEMELSKFPARNWILKIQTVAYADKQGFRDYYPIKKNYSDNPVVEELVEKSDISFELFTIPILNQILSECRGESINKYVLQNIVYENMTKIDTVIGLGETDPQLQFIESANFYIPYDDSSYLRRVAYSSCYIIPVTKKSND